MSASTVPVARAFLFDAVTTLAAVDGDVTVIYAPPTTGDNAAGGNQRIVFDEVHVVPQISAMIGSGGTGWLEEIYDLHITAEAFMAGDSEGLSTFTQCAVLVDYVIAAVRQDPSLGSNVIVARPEPYDLTPAWDEASHGIWTTSGIVIRCHARI